MTDDTDQRRVPEAATDNRETDRRPSAADGPSPSSNRRRALQAMAGLGIGAVGGSGFAAAGGDSRVTDAGTATQPAVPDGFQQFELITPERIDPSEARADMREVAFGTLSAEAQAAVETALEDGSVRAEPTLPDQLSDVRYVRRDGDLYDLHTATGDRPVSE